MDRFSSSSFVYFAAVRITPGTTIQRLLHPEHQRVGGESGADALHRRTLPANAFLRCAPHDVVAQRTRVWDQFQTSRPLDERDGIAGHAARSAHQQTAPGTSHLPLFVARNGNCPSLRRLERGHHLHPDAAWSNRIAPVLTQPRASGRMGQQQGKKHRQYHCTATS